jgi:hypothetical protein
MGRTDVSFRRALENISRKYPVSFFPLAVAIMEATTCEWQHFMADEFGSLSHFWKAT